MALSSELISQFAKLTQADKTENKETTVCGTTVEYNGTIYVQLDGSDRLTPVSTTTVVKPNERVNVLIKNHTATVTGNITSPSAQNGDVEEVGGKVSEFEIVMAYKVTANDLTAVNATIDQLKVKLAQFNELSAVLAKFETLQSKYAELEYVSANEAKILNAEIDNLKAELGSFGNISAEYIDAMNADIDNLKAYNADFTYVSADRLTALKAEIKQLDVDKLTAEQADIKYATIDFANIGEAAIKKLFSDSGIIKDLVVSEGYITGELVGVTIKGDIIQGGTVLADKLVVRGEDGLYYRLNTDGVTTEAEQTDYNSLNGSIITAKSITATKISVDDLVAFGATIGGFNITDHSLYSGVKASVDSSTRGIYMDKDGQVSIGDSDNFIRFYKTTDTNGNEVYKLEISADSLLFGSGRKSSAADLEALTEHVKVGTYTDPETGNEQPSVTLAEGDSDFKQVITNTKTMFMDGENVTTEISNTGVKTDNIEVDNDIKQSNPSVNGHFVWAVRANGNYGLRWEGAVG